MRSTPHTASVMLLEEIEIMVSHVMEIRRIS